MKVFFALLVLCVSLGNFAHGRRDSIQSLERKLNALQSRNGLAKPDCIPKDHHEPRFRNVAAKCSEFNKKYGIQNVKFACMEDKTNFTVVKYTRALCVKGETGPFCKTTGKYEKRVHASAGGPACIDRADIQ